MRIDTTWNVGDFAWVIVPRHESDNCWVLNSDVAEEIVTVAVSARFYKREPMQTLDAIIVEICYVKSISLGVLATSLFSTRIAAQVACDQLNKLQKEQADA